MDPDSSVSTINWGEITNSLIRDIPESYKIDGAL